MIKKRLSNVLPNFCCLLLLLMGSVTLQAQNWNEKATNIPVANKNATLLSIVDDNVVWSHSDSNYFTKSTNGGTTFSTVTGNLPSGTSVTDLKAISATTAYLCAWNGANVALSGVYKTVDGGTTWTRQASATFNSASSFPNCIHFFDANNGIVTGDPSDGYFEVYTTADGGTNWTRVPSSNLPVSQVDEWGVNNSFDAVGNTVWFGTSIGRVYRSRDKGVTWTVAGLPDTIVSPVFTFTNENMGMVAYTNSSTNLLSLASTTDGGETFTPIGFSGINSVGDIEYIPGTSQLVARQMSSAATVDFFSGDNGFTWTAIGSPKKITDIEFLNAATGYAGTTNTASITGGIYKFVNTVSLIGDAIPIAGWGSDLVMQTTDGTNYTATNVYILKHTADNNYRFKFRQNKAWYYNWGTDNNNNQFPSGIGNTYIYPSDQEDGSDIFPTSSGYYNVSLNRITGAYNFVLVSQPSIGLIGSANPVTGWGSDVDMMSIDGDTYVLQNQTLVTGEAKFRENDDWGINWGNTGFPSGFGYNGGPNIPVPAGVYTITFTRSNGAYNFSPYTQTCAYLTSVGNITHNTCFGDTNGSADITLNPVPTSGTVSYTVDGGASNTASLTSGVLTVSNLATGNHTIAVSIPGCTTVTAAVAINGPANAAAITTQPANTVLCSALGSTASVSVAFNRPEATYTWQYRKVTSALPDPAWITITSTNAGAVYSGYTTATLDITKATTALPAVGTQYRVLVDGGECGTVTSDTALLTVLSAVKAGTIAVSASVCTGGETTFTLSGYAGTSFQWQSSPLSTTAAPGEFTDIPGATDTTYTLTGAATDSDKSYRVVVSNSCNGSAATSATKTIKVDPVSVAGSITGGGIVCSGSNATIKTAGYVGKIQWEYSTDGTNYLNAPKAADAQTVPFGTSSANSTGGSYMVTGILADVYFRAKITSGSCSSDYTAAVHYTIGTAAVVGTVSSAAAMVCPATSTTLTLSDATGVITWQKSTNYNSATPTWTNIANSNALSISSGNIAYNTAFRAKVSIGECSTEYSELVYVSVVAKPVAKPIMKSVTSPTGNTAATALCALSNVKVLTAGAGTVGDIHWQWSMTSATAGFSDLPGATGTSYSILFPNYLNYTTNNGANYYRMRITNSCGAEVFGAVATVYFKACGGEGNGENWIKAVMPTAFNVVAYPNPYAENFSLNLTTVSEETVGVMVYDMTGKMVEKLEVNPSNSTDLQLGNNYPSGIYNVVVTQGSDLKTLRVIKQ